ncbi:MAG: glutaredoxin [Anaerolineae bacterium]|nr:MAG: glutaredoxin [Anaerolineae bacterium]
MNTRLLDDNITSQVRDAFASLEQPVKVLFFGSQEGCQYCGDTQQLLEEVTALSEKLTLETYDLQQDAETAAQYGVDKAPGIVIAADEGGEVLDYGIRYAGIPSGHEFSSLITDLIQVSRRDSGLSEATRQFLANLTEPVHMMVFVTPTCPYCPRAVVLAHQMAMESPLVHAEMVEAMEFPELSSRFGVSGVPQTTINMGKGTVVGAVPEGHLVQELQNALAR